MATPGTNSPLAHYVNPNTRMMWRSLTLSDTWQLIINLAKARELLVIDRETTMPGGARAQRERMIAVLRTIIDDELATTTGAMLETPDNDLEAGARGPMLLRGNRSSRGPFPKRPRPTTI